MDNSTIFTHFYFIKYVFVLVFKKIPLYRGFPLNLLTLNRGPTVSHSSRTPGLKLEKCSNSCLKQYHRTRFLPQRHLTLIFVDRNFLHSRQVHFCTFLSLHSRHIVAFQKYISELKCIGRQEAICQRGTFSVRFRAAATSYSTCTHTVLESMIGHRF